MPLTDIQIKEIAIEGERFLKKRRPPVAVRAELDLAYRLRDGFYKERG